MTEAQLGILADNRLSSEARLLALWVSAQTPDPEGFVELPFQVARNLLPRFPSDDTIRGHLRTLTGSGWVERKAGGRGHGDRFKVLDLPHSNTLSIQYGHSPGVSGDLASPHNPTVSDSPGVQGEAKGAAVVVDLVVAAVAGRPPSVVSPQDVGFVSSEAAAVIETNREKLAGCRGPLRDYLAQVVVGDTQQYGYAQTVVSWIDGGDGNLWRAGDGATLARELWPKLIGVALNELMAGDEKGMSRPRGHTANLRNKLRGLLQSRRSDGTERKSGPSGGPSGSGGAGGTVVKPKPRGVNDRWDRNAPGGPAGGAHS